jgi:sulfur carrier protein ThiS
MANIVVNGQQHEVSENLSILHALHAYVLAPEYKVTAVRIEKVL